MRISDWSSDVCSSDLFGDEGDPGAVLHIKIERVRTPIEELDPDLIDSDRFDQFTDIHAGSPVGAVRFWDLPAIGAPMMLAARTRPQRRAGVPGRSEERRVGKAGGGKWQFGGAR